MKFKGSDERASCLITIISILRIAGRQTRTSFMFVMLDELWIVDPLSDSIH